MIHLTIFTTGKLRQDFIAEGEREYRKRLSRFAKFELREFQPVSGKNEKEIAKLEGAAMLEALPKSCFVVACDEGGKQLSSRAFASLVEKQAAAGDSHFVFIIGGAFGLSEEMKHRANLCLSFSSMTFPRQLFRLILIEQLYRVVSLNAGVPYHKD